MGMEGEGAWLVDDTQSTTEDVCEREGVAAAGGRRPRVELLGEAARCPQEGGPKRHCRARPGAARAIGRDQAPIENAALHTATEAGIQLETPPGFRIERFRQHEPCRGTYEGIVEAPQQRIRPSGVDFHIVVRAEDNVTVCSRQAAVASSIEAED